MKKNALIWDIPTRLFHWLLVISIVAQYATAKWLDNAVQWHFYIGYFALFLVTFRILWGFVGTRYARFSQFVTGPKSVLVYLKSLFNKHAPPSEGHNPLGGWFVVVMLILVSVQAVSGLFMTDDIFLDGPYRHLATEAFTDIMSSIHHIAFDILLYVICLHISAIVFYALYKKQRLVPAMVHGRKDVVEVTSENTENTSPVKVKHTGQQDAGIAHSMLFKAVVVAIIAAVIVYVAIEVYPPAPEVDEYYY